MIFLQLNYQNESRIKEVLERLSEVGLDLEIENFGFQDRSELEDHKKEFEEYQKLTKYYLYGLWKLVHGNEREACESLLYAYSLKVPHNRFFEHRKQEIYDQLLKQCRIQITKLDSVGKDVPYYEFSCIAEYLCKFMAKYLSTDPAHKDILEIWKRKLESTSNFVSAHDILNGGYYYISTVYIFSQDEENLEPLPVKYTDIKAVLNC